MDRHAAETLLDALKARSGMVAAVGAGGKKSTLYRLLEAHRVIGTERILLTSTVQIAAKQQALDVEMHVIDGDRDVGDAITHTEDRQGAFLFAGPPTKPGRYSGLPEHLVQTLSTQAAFGLSLIHI